MSKNAITVVEITDSHIKLLQADQSGNAPFIAFCEAASISRASDQEISKALRLLLDKTKFQSQYITVSIPRRYITLKRLLLPTHDDAEIKKIIDLQIIHNIPYTREEIIFNYVVLEKDPNGYSKILAVIIQKELAQRYLAILHQARIPPTALTLSSFGVYNWYVHQVQKKNQDVQASMVIINIEGDYTEICFCTNDQLLFSRAIFFGVKDLKTNNLDAYIEQIHLTLKTYQKEEMGGALAGMRISSTFKDIGLFVERLQNDCPFPIQRINPHDDFPGKKNITLIPLWEQDGISAAAALGIAFGEPDKFINLLPSEVKATHKTRRIKRHWIKLGLLFAGTLLLLAMILGLEGYQKIKSLQSVRAEIDFIKNDAQRIIQQSQYVEILNQKFNHQILLIDLIHALHSLTPQDITFDLFDFDAEGTLSLEGSSQRGVNTLQANLVASPLFHNVNLQFAKKRKTSDGEKTYFKFVCQLSDKKRKE